MRAELVLVLTLAALWALAAGTTAAPVCEPSQPVSFSEPTWCRWRNPGVKTANFSVVPGLEFVSGQVCAGAAPDAPCEHVSATAMCVARPPRPRRL